MNKLLNLHGFIQLVFIMELRSGIKVLAMALMFMPFSSNAQKTENYKVVKVQGEIQRVKTGNLLTTGENIESNENFDFKTNYSRAVVVNKDRGCVVLSSKANNSGPQFLPSTSNMSVRAALPTQPSEVIDYYYGDIMITGFDSLKIDEDKLMIGEYSYFTVKYKFDEQEVSEKMELKNGKLVLPANLIEKKPSKVTVAYNDEFGESSKSEFNPVYADQEQLKSEIEVIFSTLKEKKANKISSATEFVNDFYGKTTIEAIEGWISKNMNL